MKVKQKKRNFGSLIGTMELRKNKKNEDDIKDRRTIGVRTERGAKAKDLMAGEPAVPISMTNTD